MAAGCNPHLPDYNRWTPLHAAASNGHFEVVEVMLAAADVPKDDKSFFFMLKRNKEVTEDEEEKRRCKPSSGSEKGEK
jgi:ankyrin repeat protein